MASKKLILFHSAWMRPPPRVVALLCLLNLCEQARSVNRPTHAELEAHVVLSLQKDAAEKANEMLS